MAEGLDLVSCATRYLGIEHGNEARAAHRQTVDAVRAIARRRGEAWRLIGLSIQQVGASRPSLDEFADGRFDGFSEAEVLELYQEAFPADRKTARSQRLRDRQLALLHRLEAMAAESPQPGDLVSGWFDDRTAHKLTAAGMVSLGDLNARIAAGGQWFRTMPAVGRAKAERIAQHLSTLLPAAPRPSRPVFTLSPTPSLFADPLGTARPQPIASTSTHPSPSMVAGRLLDAPNDAAAVHAWIDARAGSAATAKAYRREATRLLLWLQYERNRTLVQMDVADCTAYMAFLQNVPARWISRERASPGRPGWAPFRGPLSHASHRQAIVTVGALFTWLQSAQYVAANPWQLVNKKTGDDRGDKLLDTKAFSEPAMAEVLRFVDAQPMTASSARIRFILRFVESVGLRSAELLGATLGDIRLEPEGWVIQVHGKGSKNRIAAIPGQALDALQAYLQTRGLASIQEAPPAAPLLSSTADAMTGVGYQALYEHVRGWIRKAVAASALPMAERAKLAGATTHWLRHTFGTRAIAREVPLDVIQAQMGHASIQMTTGIYGRAPIRRRLDELGKAFS
ncbi:tyrosine-type recombinase/integrase [Variovorax ginsengisoli]|uniref:Site-specific recombinase XerD n=1 Tax=Variovorax ginsengisoli TaxID=363844 RepID=A0ABT9SG78_9BURK|nr:site-specific integrase [Variovorax ginsengisoli]MDP9902377.1 site-specific recombinase XerD [Variovorax ginsengisoli]